VDLFLLYAIKQTKKQKVDCLHKQFPSFSYFGNANPIRESILVSGETDV